MKDGWKRGDVADSSLSGRLDDDVVRMILAHCDIRTIVAFGQTSNHSHDLVFSSKDLWLAVARRLHTLDYIHLTTADDLYQLSANELVLLIKSIGSAPTPDSPSPFPTQTLNLTLRDTDEALSRESGVRLTKEGEYLLVGEPYIPGASLACWDVKTRSIVWESKDGQDLIGPQVKIVKFTAQVVDPNTLDILICLRDPHQAPPNDFEATYLVELWRINLTEKSTETIRLLDYEPRPGTEYYGNEIECEGDSTLLLEGDYAVAYGIQQLVIYNKMSGKTSQFYTGNEDDDDFRDFDDEDDEGGWGEEGDGGIGDEITSFAIVEGALFLGLRKKPRFEVLMWGLSSVDAHGASMPTSAPRSVAEVPCVQQIEIQVGDWYPVLQVYPSPYADNTCLLHIRATAYNISMGRRYHIYRYLVSSPVAGPVLIRQLGEQGPTLNVPLLANADDIRPSYRCVKNGLLTNDHPPLAGDAILLYYHPYTRTVVYAQGREVGITYHG